ncbi:unnamed protein product, partial [Polarella glacialis]
EMDEAAAHETSAERELGISESCEATAAPSVASTGHKLPPDTSRRGSPFAAPSLHQQQQQQHQQQQQQQQPSGTAAAPRQPTEGVAESQKIVVLEQRCHGREGEIERAAEQLRELERGFEADEAQRLDSEKQLRSKVEEFQEALESQQYG